MTTLPPSNPIPSREVAAARRVFRLGTSRPRALAVCLAIWGLATVTAAQPVDRSPGQDVGLDVSEARYTMPPSLVDWSATSRAAPGFASPPSQTAAAPFDGASDLGDRQTVKPLTHIAGNLAALIRPAAEELRLLLDDLEQRLDTIIAALDTLEQSMPVETSVEAEPQAVLLTDGPVALDLVIPDSLTTTPVLLYIDLTGPIGEAPIVNNGELFDKQDAMVTPASIPSAITKPNRSVIEIVLPSTAIAFLAAILLVPFGCSFTAGSLYGWPRDGPSKKAAVAVHALDGLSQALADVPSV